MWTCLGARGAGGALERGLGELARQGADAGVRQRGGGEQLVPAAHHRRQIQIIQEDLSHSHETLAVHAAVITPHDHLERLKVTNEGSACGEV